MVNLSRLFLSSMALVFSMPLFAVTTLQATIDKNPVMYGEEIMLQLQADEKLPRDAIDFSVLEKDFRVNGPAISQSMQIINGQSSQTTLWQLALFPKRTGDITIPAFQVDAASTSPIVVTVLEKTTASGEQPELLIQNTLSTDTLHVQQVVYYDVKIFFKGDLKSGSLTAPNVPGCAIEQLGKDVESSELLNGERYQTITRRYSVTAQQSGDFTIEAPFFKGEMIDRSGSNYDYYAKQKIISAEGQSLTFTAKPIPAEFSGDWLVSDLVALTEEWSVTGNEIVQGEPVTRTITLTALDLMDNQLPNLVMSTPEGVKVYPEQPQAKKAERNGRIVAQKVFSYAVIANKPGELELPEISLPWYNSKTNEITHTTLAKKRLVVTPNTQQPAPQAIPELTASQPVASTVATTHWWLPTWQVTLSTAVILLMWCISLLAVLKFGQFPRRTSTPAQQQGAALQVKFNRHKFKAACLANDAALTQTLLLRWAQQLINPQLGSLEQVLAALPEGELKLQIQQLCYRRYQPMPSSWQGQALFEHWAKYQHQQLIDVSSALKPLYPERAS